MNILKSIGLRERVFSDRLQWLESAFSDFARGGAKAYLANQPPVGLLTSHLEESDDRWDAGVVAWPHSPPRSEGPSVIFRYRKPADRRNKLEMDFSDREFDPPAALVQQLHIMFGGRLRLRTSQSNMKTENHPSGVPYHYPLIGIWAPIDPFDFRCLRAILDAPSNKQATGDDQYHDLRRCKLKTPWLTKQQAAERFGHQENGRYRTRAGAIEASMQAFDHQSLRCSPLISREQYQDLMVKAYQLLDCHPLKPTTV